MPLALELAAARAPSLGQDGLRAAIGDLVRLLSGGRGAEARHVSIHAVMDWSYALLDDEERSMLRGLSVFASSFDLASVASVAGFTGAPDEATAADLLGRLVDSSLVVRAPAATATRWRLLETVRAFAGAKVEAAERTDLIARHLRWATTTATGLDDLLEQSPDEWRAAFDAVVDDLREALARSSASPDPTARGLARALAHLSFARGYHREARGHWLAAAARTADCHEAFDDLCQAADVAIAGSDTLGGVVLLMDAARRVDDRGNRAAGAWARALETQIRFGYEYRALDAAERRSALAAAAVGEADPHDPVVTALVATARAWHEGDLESTDLARDAVDLARETRDPVVLLRALDALSATLINHGRLRDALDVAGERIALLAGLPRHVPAAATEISDSFQVAINLAVSTGELAEASAFLERAEVDDPTPNPYVAIPRRIAVLALTGRLAAAIAEGDELWEAWQRDETDRRWLAPAFNLVALAHGLSDDGHYELWRARTSTVAAPDGAPTDWMRVRAAFVDARTALHTGDLASAQPLVDNAFASPLGWAHRSDGYARAAGAELAVAAGLADAEDRIDEATPYVAQNRWAAAVLARARGRLHNSHDELGDAATAFAQIGADFERHHTLQLLR